MTEPITASPELMRQVADEHDAIADLLDGARARAAQVQSAVQSWVIQRKSRRVSRLLVG